MIKESIMEKTGLPAGWEMKTLGDVSDFQRGLTYSGKDAVDFSENIVLRATNIDLDKNCLDFSELKYLNNGFQVKQNKKIVKGGLLICLSSGSKKHLGKVALVTDNYNYAFGGFIGQIIPDNQVVSKYLFYNLISVSYNKYISRLTDGIGINNLKSIDLKSFEFPLPPLTQQKQIVGILDKAFAAIDTTKANAGQNLQNAKELFESYFQNIFENKGDDWKLVPFGQVCEISGGSQPPKDNFIYEPREGYVRLVQVRDYRTDKYITYIPINKAKKFCKADDIMIGRYGPPIFGIFSGIEGAYNVALIKAIPNESIINKEYIRWFLKTPNIVKFVEKTSKRAAGQDGVRKERLYEYNIPVPAFPEQKKIVETLDKLSLETKKLESIYTQKIADLEEMKKSVLQKAFSGQLNTIN